MTVPVSDVAVVAIPDYWSGENTGGGFGVPGSGVPFSDVLLQRAPGRMVPARKNPLRRGRGGQSKSVENEEHLSGLHPGCGFHLVCAGAGAGLVLIFPVKTFLE